jgi:hypothetical protein
MAATRIYRSIVTVEGHAVTQQVLRVVPNGEAPETSPSAVDFVEVTRVEGTTTYKTGEYYADIPVYGLWDIYVKDNNTGIWKMYQERQFVGGIDLISGGALGFTVYEAISPVPNDGGYWLVSFPATGLDTTKVLSAVFGTPGAKYDTAYGLVRDTTVGLINVKISAAVNDGVHLVNFDQGGIAARAIFRVVDIANAYSSPVYNYVRNAEFQMDADVDSVPDYWYINGYFSFPALPPVIGKSILANGFRLSLTGSAVIGSIIAPGDVVYLVQTASLGIGLTQPSTFTFSVTPDLSGVGGCQSQVSLTAIAQINGADTVLATTAPLTFSSNARQGMKIDCPAGTTHIRIAMNLVNNTGADIPAAGATTCSVLFEKAKLNVGLDMTWYS